MLKNRYQAIVKENYEQKAKDCTTCDSQGACCTDAHFVNTHITKLEAIAVNNVLEELGFEKSDEINQRVKKAIEKYDLLDQEDTFKKLLHVLCLRKKPGVLFTKKESRFPVFTMGVTKRRATCHQMPHS